MQRSFVSFHVVLSLEADLTYIAYPLRRFVYCSTMTPEFVRSTEGSFPTEVAVGLTRCGGGVRLYRDRRGGDRTHVDPCYNGER